MNNRMLRKTRGRRRHIRSTRRKFINCTNWKERNTRSNKKSSKRRNKRKQRKRRTHKKRMHGGRSNEPTIDTIDGFPVIEDADVSIPGYGTIPIDKFKEHENYVDFQGSGGEPGYD